MSEAEQERLHQLVHRVGQDDATDAEVEELKLYLQDNPALVRQVRDEVVLRKFGGGWLERLEADQAIVEQERRPVVRAERGVGLGLMALGFLGSFFHPVAGVGVLAGMVLLLFSFIRTGVSGARRDPYRDVDQ